MKEVDNFPYKMHLELLQLLKLVIAATCIFAYTFSEMNNQGGVESRAQS